MDKRKLLTQIGLRNDLSAEIAVREDLAAWVEAYFQFEVTTLESSQKVQRRDIGLFLHFLRRETGETRHRDWTPRVSQAFKTWLASEIDEKRGRRRWNDRTVNRILAHLRTLAKWIHRHHPFPLDNPMRKIKSLPAASLLEIERALTPQERRRILDAADLLVTTGGRSKDRNRYPDPTNRPQRKNYRPWRNRAIIYTLIETGMRRAAVTHIRLSGVDAQRRTIETVEKGGMTHRYAISREGMQAILDFLTHERHPKISGTPYLYTSESGERLTPKAINDIWNSVCLSVGVEGKSPHSARHAMGKHLQEKTSNIAAVQRQLGHCNATYSSQYARVADREIQDFLDQR